VTRVERAARGAVGAARRRTRIFSAMHSVTRTYLELRGPTELTPGRPLDQSVELVHRRPISAGEYRALYDLVGERWLWRDRRVWSDQELHTYLASSRIHVWSAHQGSETVGYFELQQHADAIVEIMYFGLTPRFIGRGIGGWLLTRAAEEAFNLGGERLVLNTCTLDSPHALPNYLARGFRIVREEQYLVDLPRP
jgi:GNAT superfamily N-acetyltransferase